MLNNEDRALLRSLPYKEARQWTQQFVDVARLPETREPVYLFRDWNVLADIDPIDADAICRDAERIHNLPEVSNADQ